ncbi:MAG: mannose-1-phosphate guanylyltransferase/mannose-6-phosphate isomerase [Burkholderiaceae bacterium]|nr:MAG: mannose-1-phosphate guanylyltransferase/mannose-6-phosphate isomerase [Burkholderiaceae bacterium]
MALFPVILCGGAGSRLWPVSREQYPKPFMRLADGQSLLQKALLRATSLEGVTEVLVVSNRDLFFTLVDDLREVEVTDVSVSFVLEPLGRDTAAAVAAAALQVARTHGEDAELLILAADHLVADQAGFQSAVGKARELAREGKLVTFGIQPTSPETGYGYIEAEGSKVLRFVEKPSPEKAREYVDSGRFFWNSGMFCFTVSTLLAEMERHCPDILAATRKALDQARIAEGQGMRQIELDRAAFDRVPRNSIDYALMEKSDAVAVVPCAIGWSDIGSWNAVSTLTPADASGNRLRGDVVVEGATDCYVRADGRVVGVVGVHGLVIVDTADALLVSSRESCQDVKQVYARLKARGSEAYKLHRTVHRPWGTYTVLEEGVGFKIKRIEVKPGAQLSLQMHHHRSEHWVVVRGTAQVTADTTTSLLRTNQSTYIPAGHKHRLANPGPGPLAIIEVQSGDYVGEDDIVRFDDAYGRV